MILRDATPDDLAEITALQVAFDRAWFGRPEHDEDEVREWTELADRLAVVEDGDRLVAVANRWRTGSMIVVDPAAEGPAALALLLPWLTEVGAPETEVLDRDQAAVDALTAAGWRHEHSTFDLLRPLEADWTRPAAQWPTGVEVRELAPGEEPRLHELIYAAAGWADVPGHHYRDPDEWRQIFLAGRRPEERPLVAVEKDRLVGAALPRLFSDGTGWIAQLAVARSARGRGLGRALLLTGFERMVAAGATQLGLAVLAENRAALRLYLDIGLRIDREWQSFAAPGQELEVPAHTGGSV
jgi:ribosomal protein S18 acetylase RimI-like enzyme